MRTPESSKEWEDFVSARKQYLGSIRAMRKLSPELQAAALDEALNKSQLLDVMEYLRTVENPSRTSKLPVARLMLDTLGNIAAVPGENAPTARAYIESLAKDQDARPAVSAMAERKVSECLTNPNDEEVWVYTAEILRAIDENRFNAFLDICKSHPSEKIREVATFFLE